MRKKTSSSLYQYQNRPADFLDYHCLDFNEYQGDIAPSTKAVLKNPRLMQYYPLVDKDPIARLFVSRLSIPAKNISLANGADDALFHTLLTAKTKLNCRLARPFFHPSYTHTAQFMKTLNFKILPPFQNSSKASLSSPAKQIIYLSSPNNPKGEEVSPEELSALIRVFKKNFWILDFTYALYSRYSLKNYAKTVLAHKNTLGIMSLGKSFPLAGLRMAVVFSSNSDLLSYFREDYNKKTIGTIARTAALDCLKQWSFYKNQRLEIWKNKTRLAHLFNTQALKKNIRVKSEHTNKGGNFFCMSGSLKERGRFIKYLYSKKIIVRTKKNWSFIRVTSVNNKTFSKIKKAFKTSGQS